MSVVDLESAQTRARMAKLLEHIVREPFDRDNARRDLEYAFRELEAVEALEALDEAVRGHIHSVKQALADVALALAAERDRG